MCMAKVEIAHKLYVERSYLNDLNTWKKRRGIADTPECMHL